MRNKGLIIILIILLLIIVGGLIAFLVLCLNGSISLKDFHIGGRKSDNLLYNEKYSIEEITSIDVTHDAGDVIFENIEENNIKVEVYGENKEDVELSLHNNKLTINYKNKNHGLFNNVYGDIKLYVPSIFFGNIKINNDAGEIKIADFENADFNIDCDAGNVDIGKIKGINAKCDAGNLKIDSISEKCDIRLDAGNLKINKITLKEDSKIKTDMGNVDINEANNIYIDADVDLGKCNISNNNRNAEVTLKIDCDMGNVNVK